MRALWLENQRLQLREDLPRPAPASGEALVRVRLAGICATDLELTRGYDQFTGVPGHEFVGEIAEAPDAPERVGERVVGEINIACGSCDACRAGRRNHCERREVLGIRGRNGAFAEYLSLPLSNLHPVPETVPDELAVFCEPLAAALRIQDQQPIVRGERVLLVGAGRLGQLIAITLAATGCRLTVAARHPRQRELLDTAGIAGIDESGVDERAYDLVIEASGSPGGLDLALRSVRPCGTLVLKSTYADRARVDLSRLVVNEVTLVGSRCGAFKPALALLRAGGADPRALIDGRFPLAQAVDAFEQAGRPGAMKVLVEPSAPPQHCP
jgi:threonine dehydrogenase-like Zn-dependent dehydrogenase